MRCRLAHDFTVAKVLAWRHALYDDPPYQRQSAVWSLDRQQRFIDSLLNGYDVPKIYLHDLRGQHPTRVYALVDGKQRVTTIWRFLRDEFPLSPRFRVEDANLPELPPGTPPPLAGQRFSEFHPAWQRVLRGTGLSVVLIQNATEEDIEELFARLNNGQPLNAAEKRNARGGEMAKLVRELAGRPFFTERLRFGNARLRHHDLAARLLLIEQAGEPGAPPPDLGSRALDHFVTANRRIGAADRAALLARTDRRLAHLCRAFGPADPLLASQSAPPLYYLLSRSLAAATGAEPPPERLREFLERFAARRRAERDLPPERRDPALAEFARGGAWDRGLLERRLEVLTGRYLEFVAPAIQRAG
jgi:hypothetical protein